jgi:hypothetical protein
MSELIAVTDVREALQERRFPTVTVWNRLEGRPRTSSFEKALAAESRDALWYLSRQWQLGEFRADDAASPFFAKLHVSTTRVTKYRPGDYTAEPFEDDVPLEAKVERRPIPLARDDRPMSLDLRLLLGRQWLKLIEDIGYRQEFIDHYRITAPSPAIKADADQAAHPEAWQLFAAAADRLLDGGSLLLHVLEDPTNHAYDDIAGIAEVDKPPLDAAAARFIASFRRLLYQPPTGDDAWVPERLEYRFAISAPEAAGEKVLAADEYYHGHLDWYSVDVERESPGFGAVAGAEGAGLPEGSTQTLIPVPIEYEGMPNTRWWAFEDRKTNFGAIDAATTDLAKLLFVEFGLVYANDWFVVPCPLDAGSLATVRGIAVTNVFGERTWIEPAGSGADEDWQQWRIFTSSVAGDANEEADTALLLLPTVPKIQESAPVEEVLLLRDELANMVWGVERVRPLPSGTSVPGSEAAAETTAFYRQELDRRLPGLGPDPVPLSAAPIRYQVMTTVPENWIPFIPVHVPGDVRETQLQRAALPRILEGDRDPPDRIRPRTMLLRHGLDTTQKQHYFLFEEEVPRWGALALQSFQRTRGPTGRVFTWLGVRKQAGRGEGSSGLAFDQIVDVPADRRA